MIKSGKKVHLSPAALKDLHHIHMNTAVNNILCTGCRVYAGKSDEFTPPFPALFFCLFCPSATLILTGPAVAILLHRSPHTTTANCGSPTYSRRPAAATPSEHNCAVDSGCKDIGGVAAVPQAGWCRVCPCGTTDRLFSYVPATVPSMTFCRARAGSEGRFCAAKGVLAYDGLDCQMRLQ